MKEMIYRLVDYETEVLDSGEYKGVKYCIVNRNTHPSAYIAVSGKFEDIVGRNCHGGCTYSDCGVPQVPGTNDNHWLGWDYGHPEDHFPWLDNDTLRKKWTTNELVRETKEVIDKLIESVFVDIDNYLRTNDKWHSMLNNYFCMYDEWKDVNE